MREEVFPLSVQGTPTADWLKSKNLPPSVCFHKSLVIPDMGRVQDVDSWFDGSYPCA